ncbi:hypothetical protein, partial [Sphingorhabdus sp.]|uniref:hypothetical protein n=1 Tax=Sphingorhabdus sp. TaxID=1902408 RepID=UPI00391A243F
VSVQLFRVGRTIVSGWTMPSGQQRAPDSSMPIQPAGVPASSGNMVYNERMQSLVGAIERSAVSDSTMSAAGQRAIMLPQRITQDGIPAVQQQNVQSDRRISRGYVQAARAPFKAFRNAA